MGRLYTDAGHIYLEDGSAHVGWSTEAPPVQLLPEADTIVAAVSIVFPDLEKNNAYGFDRSTDILGFTYENCASVITVVPQEWGPAEGGGKALATATLGTVPAGVNYIDVTANLTRSAAPSQWVGVSILPIIAEGQTTRLVGGSCIVERLGDVMTRLFEVKLSGTSVVLDRYQSVLNAGATAPWVGSTSVDGWTHGGNTNGHFAYPVEAKTAPNGLQRGQGGQCSLTDPTSYASTYTGTITIRPGIFKS